MNQNNYTTSLEKFYDANEGFVKGNLSKCIYKQYKNYKPKEIKTNNEKDALLLFILKCDLAVQDLNLYLDIHEKDNELIKMLNFYKKELSNAKETYLNKYGPLLPCQITPTFTWNDNPFPWEA